MATFEIPLSPESQRFSISLSGTTYVFRVYWSAAQNCWAFDIFDATDVLMVAGIPLITGADLLEQYGYLGIPGQLIVQSDSNTDAVPTFQNLGTIGHLYYVDAAA